MRKYEALFIFVNTITDEELETKIGQIGSEITKLGGKLQSATRMGRIPFARPIAKKETGVYVQVVFDLEPEKVPLLHEHYRHKEDLIRLQIVATKSKKENPVLTAKRFAHGTTLKQSTT